MRDVLDALAEQHAELDALLTGLDDNDWTVATPRCPGWNVADVVLHMAQTDEMAAASARGDIAQALNMVRSGDNVDDGASRAVEQERGTAPADLLARWRAAAAAARDGLAAADPATRLPWVTNTLRPATLATTRLAECWIHTGDIADGLGRALAFPARVRHVAWLAWRTLAYAFEQAGEKLHGPVAVTLAGPDGSEWRFADDVAAVTTVAGPAEDWCMVAARRRDPADASLKAEGPDADAVLRLVRTYA
jgi:uncharacterized protein (TIGR03084 family)